MPDMPTSGMPELPPSDYPNMSTEQIQNAIQDLRFIIKKEKEGCRIPAIFGRNPYLEKLRENLTNAEAALESRPDADWSKVLDPDIPLGAPATAGQWLRPGVLVAVVVAGVVVVGGVAEGVFNAPINIRGDNAGGSNLVPTLAQPNLPAKKDVCGITSPDYLNGVLAPLPIPLGAGNPIESTKESKSTSIRCEFVVGTVGSPGYIDLIATYARYDPSKPFDTSKLQAVPNLGDDAFFSGASKYNNFTLTARKSKALFTVYLAKEESADDALKQEKDITQHVFDYFRDNPGYNLIG